MMDIEDVVPELTSREAATRGLVTRAFTMLMTVASDGVRMAGRDGASLTELLTLAKDIQQLTNILVDSLENAIGAASTLHTIALAQSAASGDRTALVELADKLEAGGFTHSAAAARKILGS